MRDLAGTVRRRTAVERVGFFLLLVAVGAAILVSPFALISLAKSIRHPVAADAFHLAVPAASQDSTTAMNVRLVAIDETAQNVTLGVTGDRRCATACGAGQVIQFFSLRADPQGSDGAPPSQSVTVPASGEFDGSVVLPISGGLGSYPFDHYHLILGLALADETANGQEVSVPASVARHQLDVSLDEELPRFDIATPKDMTGSFRFVGSEVALAATVDLSRPLYLQALTIFIIVFIAIAGVYSVVTRAFKDVIATVGVVVLGVWGVRTLLVGSYPPDSTAVDLILEFLILALLMILTVRGLLLMWGRVRSADEVNSGHEEHEDTQISQGAEGGADLEAFSEIA